MFNLFDLFGVFSKVVFFWMGLPTLCPTVLPYPGFGSVVTIGELQGGVDRRQRILVNMALSEYESVENGVSYHAILGLIPFFQFT